MDGPVRSYKSDEPIGTNPGHVHTLPSKVTDKVIQLNAVCYGIRIAIESD